MKVLCDYCKGGTELISGKKLYPHRTDLRDSLFWYCGNCEAWVGCHGKTNRPLGRLANKELRFWKQQTHKAFDQFWKNGSKMTRREAYGWLSVRLEIPHRECHIGMFDLETCKNAIKICETTSDR